jgi:secretion/DNA translocation related TadE-like protein
MSSDRGAGSILAVGVMAAVIGIVLLLVPLYTALLVRSRLTGAADAAALAAADVAIGIAPGVPCRVAASVAGANGATMADCRADGVIVTVRVSVVVLGFPVSASATAGPPPSQG